MCLCYQPINQLINQSINMKRVKYKLNSQFIIEFVIVHLLARGEIHKAHININILSI